MSATESAKASGYISKAAPMLDVYKRQDGTFTRIFDKINNREVLKEGERGNVIQAFEDRPHNYDAWDINIYYGEKMWEADKVTNVKVACDTCLLYTSRCV